MSLRGDRPDAGGDAPPELSEELSELFALDSEAGPARKISEAEAQRMVAAVVDPPRAIEPQAGGRRQLWTAAAAGIAAALIAGGAVAAWYRARPLEPRPQVVEAPVRAPIEPPLPELERAPEDLLARANALRGEQRWAEAEKVYAEVVEVHPRSQAAYVAAIAAAALRLEHLGDPQSALVMYKRARQISRAGALDADVLFGMAAAHRELGDVRREKKVLDRLLKLHPRSVFAPTAQRRLAELTKR